MVVEILVLVDHCRTPLAQCQFYARQIYLDAEFIHFDIRELTVAPVDIVMAHSFLHFFPGAARNEVIRMWFKVLKPMIKNSNINEKTISNISAKISMKSEKPRLTLKNQEMVLFQHDRGAPATF